MNIKVLQDIFTEMVVSMFWVSTATKKECILGELKMILTKAQSLTQEEDPTKFYFSIYPEVGENEMLPAINLHIQNAKLQGQDVSLFNKLSNRAQYACKSWHVEVAKKNCSRHERALSICKRLGHCGKILGQACTLHQSDRPTSNLRETKNQVNLAQSHTNYQMSMTAEDLIGVILLNETSNIIHPVTKTVSSMLSLLNILLHYLKMSDGHSVIAEAHQEELLKPTTIIIPITIKAERMPLMMNKNLPSFLWHMLCDQDMPEDFIKDLLGKSCKASLVANVYKCTWDQTTRTLTTKEEEEKD